MSASCSCDSRSESHLELSHFLWIAVVGLLFFGRAASAQDISQPPSHVVAVEGVAYVAAQDGQGWQPALVNMAIASGDRVRTELGRMEVMFADGSGIVVQPDTEVEFVTPVAVRVVAGIVEHRAGGRGDAQSASAGYLPQELRAYAPALDDNGTWEYDQASSGYVWYPWVESDWRPYSDGEWMDVPSYGWTWVGLSVWSWPTDHYGHWGWRDRGWYWIPGKSWAPAWVAWAESPDYVGWCPLGPNGRAVRVSSQSPATLGGGWTVIPRSAFGARGHSVHGFAIEPRRLPAETAFVFTSANGIPAANGIATGGRSGEPVRQGPRRRPANSLGRAPQVAPMLKPPVASMSTPPVTPMAQPPVSPMATPPVTPMARPPVTPMLPPVTPMLTPPVTPMQEPPVRPMRRPPVTPIPRPPVSPMVQPPVTPMVRPPVAPIAQPPGSREHPASGDGTEGAHGSGGKTGTAAARPR